MIFKKLFNNEKLKGMLIGSIITILATSPLLIFAGSEAITAYLTDIKVLINGEQLVSDKKPVIVNGTSMFSIRDIANAFNKNVSWDGETSTIAITDKATPKPKPTRAPVSTPTPTVAPTPTPTPTSTPVNTNYVFRKVAWGMTREQVIASEGGKMPDRGDNTIMGYYDVSVNGLKFDLVFQFNERNELYTAALISMEEHSNQNLFIDDYKSCKQALIKKYGNPKFLDDMTWNNDLFAGNEKNYGLAVATGHLVYASSWELPETTIGLSLYGDNYKIKSGIQYTSTKIAPLKKENGL